MIAAVIVHVAFPGLGDAAAVVALKLAGRAGPAGAMRTVLIRVIAAVIFSVTLPGLWDAALVGTLPLVGFALVVG